MFWAHLKKLPNMQVTTFIDGKEPPMLLLWGAGDTLVGEKLNMAKLIAKIELSRAK